ncbi:hypothetical protein [Tateyamaria sp. SN6-1]|uniref:hypothetical protein n=1 Tax=Tateyamaria sp. SN6-1 TaxID=3092148 RepID=UPI0039F634FA
MSLVIPSLLPSPNWVQWVAVPIRRTCVHWPRRTRIPVDGCDEECTPFVTARILTTLYGIAIEGRDV